MSPNLSSLALDDVQDETLGMHIATSFIPDLHVIQSRYGSRHRSYSSANATTAEDVVHIGGRFTISF